MQPLGTIVQTTDLSMQELLARLNKRTETLSPGEVLTFDIPDPDLCLGCYAGERFEYAGQTYRHHSWHSWSTLAHLLRCRMMTPRPARAPLMEVRFQKLSPEASFHHSLSHHEQEGARKGSHCAIHRPSSKYHPEGIFSRIDKREEPDFLYNYLQALEEVKITQKQRILDLGVYRGDEFAVIDTVAGEGHGIEMVGVDHDEEAIAHARARLPHAAFYTHDINDLAALDLGHFDLLVTIGTLQSPSIETKPLVMNWVQNYLRDEGAMIVGFPSSRWIDGELILGAKAPNYSFSELSLLIKDIYWIKKYLQQHRFRVRIFGQSYLFLVATKISKGTSKSNKV
jgi:trans-aconitate methyltransferase